MSTQPNRSARQDADRLLIAGINKHLTALTSVMVDGVSYTPTQIVALLQAEIDTALSLKPDHTFALFAKMLFLFEAPGIIGGDKSQAFATAAQIERIEPARGNFGLARLAAHDKKTAAQAESYYLKAIELNPRY